MQFAAHPSSIVIASQIQIESASRHRAIPIGRQVIKCVKDFAALRRVSLFESLSSLTCLLPPPKMRGRCQILLH
jgi:hypothetical protein